MLTIAIVATKGGVGKTTITANLGGLMADMGKKVLLIDADIQPSLTKYFHMSRKSPLGLTSMVMQGQLTDDCVSRLEISNCDVKRPATNGHGHLHLVKYDTSDGKLQEWMVPRLDHLVRIRMALKSALAQSYDVVLIDTQGAIGKLQDAAINAADFIIAPASPDILSAREFIEGTLRLLEHHESSINMGHSVPGMKAVINRIEKTTDSKTMVNLIRENFMEMRGRVSVLDTMIPAAVAYKKAATAKIPVHLVDPTKSSDVMHKLLWELIPSMIGKHAPNHRDFAPDPEESPPV